jgi:hypothetical protein
MDSFVEDFLQPSQVRVLMAHNGIVVHCSVASLHFRIVCGFSRSDHQMLDTEAPEPEGEATREGILRLSNEHNLAVGLYLIRQCVPQRKGCTER